MRTFEQIFQSYLCVCVSVWGGGVVIVCLCSILSAFTCSTFLLPIDWSTASQVSLCSFQIIVLLIKHNWLTISVLFAALLICTYPHPFPGSPQPRACCQGNWHLISEVSVHIFVFMLSSNNLSPLSLSVVSLLVALLQTHTQYSHMSYTFRLTGCAAFPLWPPVFYPLYFFRPFSLNSFSLLHIEWNTNKTSCIGNVLCWNR